MSLVVTPYVPRLRERWDEFVRGSKNGTFLIQRDYLEYHGTRFADASLVVERGGELLALFPANRSGDEVHSHQGLTYGGLISDRRMTTPLMLEVFAALCDKLRADGATRLHYKTVPHIYHRLPAEEDRYALFRAGARLTRRDVLSVIRRDEPGPVQARRRRGARQALAAGVEVAEDPSDWPRYWDLLTENLMARYGAPPVHSLDEILLLRARFPAGIRLFTARLQGDVVAGVVVYDTPRTAHVQYIGSNAVGRSSGALDLIFFHLIDEVFRGRSYFDFGISNERQGMHLNTGLIDVKEGHGGRAVAHDFYVVDL